MKRTFQPSTEESKQARIPCTYGYPDGRKVLARRRAKGRLRLTVSSSISGK